MAWTFRRKIKVAPGVHINLSKSGVSTSIGPKGAKVTVGSNGTYLHTGIPGTGIYNRQKIGSAPKSSTPSTTLGISTSSSNGSIGEDTSNNKGCIKFFIWILCIISGILIISGIWSIVDTKKNIQLKNKEYSQLISQENIGQTADETVFESRELELQGEINELQNSLTPSYMLLALFSILFIFSILWLVKRATFEPSKSLTDAETSSNLRSIRTKIANTSDPLKKEILKNHLGHLIQQDANKRIKPLVDKWAKKVEKNPTPKNQEQFRIYEEQYNSAITESESLIFNVDDKLSDAERTAYADFCESFRAVRSCSKVWKILFSVRNTELKSSAYASVQRESTTLQTGIFDKLSFSNGVPVFPTSDGKSIYFYPKFVVAGKTISDFEVLPISSVNLAYKSTRFIEDGTRPADAKQVDTTYRYINKNGGPDRRYSYNPVMPVFLYGDITLQPYGDTFQCSNNDAAMKMDMAFKIWKSSCASAGSEPLDNDHSDFHPIKPSTSKDQEFDLRYDSLIRDAAEIVITTQTASTSTLQRELEIGFNRAGRIMMQLERLGIVGPQNGAFPRVVLIKNISELDNIFNPNYKEPENTAHITEQYFNDLLSAAKRLLDFGNSLVNNPEFCKIVTNEIRWNGEPITADKDNMSILLLADVVHCYMGLGHKINISSKEGLGLFIFNMLMIDPDFQIEYRSLDLIRDKLKDSVEGFISKNIPSIKDNTNIFILEACLKEFDNQLHNQYVVLLYRFASLIAKADKKISEEESDWLNKIMALKVPEGEDAITPMDLTEEPDIKKKTSARRPRSNAAKELENLIGLTSVKSEITSLTNYIKVQKMREEKGMKVTPVSLHCVFTGNPGTGKTTVARIVSEIYKELGLLKKGHLVETDRSGLVAEYVGQTAVKTNKIIDSALDGILFIDEAYSLVDGGNSDYGKEAIATLLKRMEDERDRLVVILAGYTDDMKRFIDSNPGLQSRFNRYIEFPDYSADELYQIFCSSAKKYEYTLADEAQAALKEIFESAVTNKDKNFGNGRFVRNLFEKVVEHQANRLSAEADVSAETLATIKSADIQN